MYARRVEPSCSTWLYSKLARLSHPIPDLQQSRVGGLELLGDVAFMVKVFVQISAKVTNFFHKVNLTAVDGEFVHQDFWPASSLSFKEDCFGLFQVEFEAAADPPLGFFVNSLLHFFTQFLRISADYLQNKVVGKCRQFHPECREGLDELGAHQRPG